MRFEEAVKNPELKAHYDRVIAEAKNNRLFKKLIERGIKEGLFSDEAAAIGRIHDRVYDAAYPAAIGREIITVRTTTQPKERFIKRGKTEAYVASEGADVYVVPAKVSYVDISADIILKATSEWTRELVEDATWNVMDFELQALGKAIAEKETKKVLSVYDAISASNLAGGSELDGGNAVMSWSLLLKLFNALKGENYSPTVVVMHPTHAIQLLNDDKFIHSAYLPSESNVRNGILTRIEPLGINVAVSTLVTAGKVYMIDANMAGVMLVRRDITTEAYEDPKEGLYGVVATERIGIGIINSKAVARMTNIGTSV